MARKNAVPFQIRQGDVLIIAVPELPEAPVVPAVGGNLLLALGETTGHAHYVRELDAVMYEANEAMKATAAEVGVTEGRVLLGGLKVGRSTTLFHGTPTEAPAAPTDGDHTHLDLPPGNYVFAAPRTFTDEQEFVRVVD